jgi:hypothetical protein
MIATLARTRRFLAGLLMLLAGLGPAAAQNDLSVIALTQPVSGCALSAENVTIRIFNYGNSLPAGTTFIVAYSVNGAPPVSELLTLPTTLLGNSTIAYTFTTQANLITPGSYTIDATLSLPGDVTPSNDAFPGTVIANSAPSVGGTLNTPPAGPSGTLSLSGQTGAVVQWEESPDNQRWFKLANTTTTQAYAGVTATTRYRVRVRNGACPAALSSVAVVTP